MSGTASILGSFRHFFGYAPVEGPLTIPLTLDFTQASSYSIDLTKEVENSVTPWVQGVYVDNSLNPGNLSINFGMTNQTLTIPAFYQGFLPCMCPNAPKFTVSMNGTTSNTQTVIQLLSSPVPAAVWPTLDYGISSVSPDNTWQYNTNGSYLTSGTTVLNAAQSSGVRNYLESMQIINQNSVGTEIQILDGATAIWDYYLPPDTISLCSLIVNFGSPLRGSSATAMNFKIVTSLSGTGTGIFLSAQGYVGR